MQVAKRKSPGVAKLDPRAQRTRARLATAFVALLERRSYERIRVSDITRKARVGRATFYAHFASRDALFEAELARVVLPMLVELPDDPCLVDCTRLFAHVQHARGIYRAVTAGSARMLTERLVAGAIARRVGRILATRGTSGLAAPGFAPQFVASTLLALLAWSLEQRTPPSPSALQDTFRALTGRALT